MTPKKDSRIALVTGGTSGIGRCVARFLHEDGFEVIVIGRKRGPLQSMAAEGFVVIQGDVSDEKSVHAVMAKIERRFGRLDALVHCAGVVESEPAESITAESTRRQVDINLVGTILVNHAAISLLKRNGGSIVNFSTAIVHAPIAGTSVYAATKAGVEGFSRALAFELGPDQIRVNVIVPSLVRSNIWLAAGMSRAAHPAPERLLLFLAGELGAAERRAVVRHLLAGCPQCTAVTRAEWARLERLPSPRHERERPAGPGFRRTRSRRGERPRAGELGSEA